MVALSNDSVPSEASRQQLRVRDFTNKSHITLESDDDRLTPEDTLIEGRFLHQELRSGLFLHASDAIEERPFVATSELREELSCIFFLDGAVDVTIGDRHFDFRAQSQGGICGAAIMSANPERFRRASIGRQRVRHLVISATPEWLDLDGTEEAGIAGPSSLFKNHLAEHRWTVTPKVTELVREVFAAPAFTPHLRSLYLEARAVAIVAETINAVLSGDRPSLQDERRTHKDLARLQRAKDFIETHLLESLQVETIARQAGMSASALQRLFRTLDGHGVFEHVRRLRLERAYSALVSQDATVQQASLIAGYSTPANFATAFKRQFGVSPREAGRQSTTPAP